MKLHQQGNEIIVTELRPMSKLKECCQVLLFNEVEESFLPGYKVRGDLVEEDGSPILPADNIKGWLPMPQYRPELKLLDK